MTLRARLAASLGAVLAVGLVAAAVATIVTTRAGMLDSIDETLRDASRRPPPIGPPPDASGAASQAEESPEARSLAVLVYDPAGGLVVSVPSGFVDNPDPVARR